MRNQNICRKLPSNRIGIRAQRSGFARFLSFASWPFNKPKIILSSHEFAAALLEMTRRNAKDLCADLQRQAERKWGFDPDETAKLDHQIFVAHLWMACKTLTLEKQIMDVFYEKKFAQYHDSDLTKAEKMQSELHQMDGKYSKAWEDDLKVRGGVTLSFWMAQFFFSKRRFVLDTSIQAAIQAHTVQFIGALQNFKSRHEIGKLNASSEQLPAQKALNISHSELSVS